MTDKLKQAVETDWWNLEAITTSDWRRWEDSATPERFEDWVKNKASYSADALRQALAQEVIGCFDAAEVEGLSIALAETTDERLRDLVERRLMYALYAAKEALRQALEESQDSPTGIVEPDTGIDRGAWSDVSDASKWVDELRGDEESEILKQSEPLEYWNAVEGWVKIDEVREHFDSVGCGTIYKSAGEGRAPLYTTPPQRTWVGLTDEEMEDLTGYHKSVYGNIDSPYAFARAIEAKLKEKNA